MNVRRVILRFPEDPIIEKKYYLPFDALIANEITRGFQIPIGNEISGTFSTTGKTMLYITTDMIKNFLITLCDNKGNEIYKDLTPYTFTVINNNGIIREMLNAKIDTSRSFIRWKDTTGAVVDNYMMFDFYTQTIQS